MKCNLCLGPNLLLTISFENSSHLLAVNYYSRFPVVRKLHRMTGKHVKSHTLATFSEYSWPDTLDSDSDNGPCYTLIEFRQVMDDMVSTSSQAHLIITSQMVLQKSMYNLSKVYYTMPKSQMKTHTLP